MPAPALPEIYPEIWIDASGYLTSQPPPHIDDDDAYEDGTAHDEYEAAMATELVRAMYCAACPATFIGAYLRFCAYRRAGELRRERGREVRILQRRDDRNWPRRRAACAGVAPWSLRRQRERRRRPTARRPRRCHTELPRGGAPCRDTASQYSDRRAPPAARSQHRHWPEGGVVHASAAQLEPSSPRHVHVGTLRQQACACIRICSLHRLEQ